MSYIPTQKTLTIAGRTFTEAEITAFESGTSGIILYAFGAVTSGRYNTPRKQDASSGFTTASNLKVVAVRVWCGSSAINVGVTLGYGDADSGVDNASAPTNAVFMSGYSGSVAGIANIFVGSGGNNQPGEAYLGTGFSVPANKYLFVRPTNANVTVEVFCTIT